VGRQLNIDEYFFYHRIEIMGDYISKMLNMPEPDIDAVDSLAVQAKKERDAMRKLMRTILPVIIKRVYFMSFIHKGNIHLITDIVHHWLTYSLPQYVKNFSLEKGNFLGYINKHIKGDAIRIMKKLAPEYEISLEDIFLNPSSSSFETFIELFEIEEKLQNLWNGIEWKSKIYKKLYCTLFYFLPDFEFNKKKLKLLKTCLESPKNCFSLHLILELIQPGTHIIDDNVKLLKLLQFLEDKNIFTLPKDIWTSSNLPDRIRNMREWLRKQLKEKL